MFTTKILEIKDSFNRFTNDIEFEDFNYDVKAAVLVNSDIPIVRTTRVYNNPVQKFPIEYNKFIEKYNLDTNNAMVEIYNEKYTKMKYHTDQSVDLDPNSYISIFSCYENPEGEKRILKIKNKMTKEIIGITMMHNSMITFSVSTNHAFLHKIIGNKKSNNKWLGITFRKSKFFNHDKSLRMANEQEHFEFYKHKSNENKYIHYDYNIKYTISPSDLMNCI